MHAESKLYLVFEFLDMDLKRYMETGNANNQPITLDIVKVSLAAVAALSFDARLPRFFSRLLLLARSRICVLRFAFLTLRL